MTILSLSPPPVYLSLSRVHGHSLMNNISTIFLSHSFLFSVDLNPSSFRSFSLSSSFYLLFYFLSTLHFMFFFFPLSFLLFRRSLCPQLPLVILFVNFYCSKNCIFACNAVLKIVDIFALKTPPKSSIFSIIFLPLYTLFSTFYLVPIESYSLLLCVGTLQVLFNSIV